MIIQKIRDFKGNIKAELNHFSHVKTQATDYAHKKLWWDEICRQISPDIFNILKDKLEIDDFLVECIIVGKNQGTTEGIPGETAYTFQKKLFNTTLRGCIIQVTEALVHIPTEEAQRRLQEAIYYNEGNQKNYMESNELGVPNYNLQLDKRDMQNLVETLHDNKENSFDGAYVVTIWAEDVDSMKRAKSHIKGVMREHLVLGQLPLRKVYEAFMTGQPYPDMADFATIDMYSGLASILSPTINPLSPLSGTDTGIYLGHEIETGKTIALDFWSEAAPHVLIIGATGSGKTYAIILLMIRLYLEGRTVMYLTKKRDDHTKYRAIAEHFGENGAIIEIGRGNSKHKRMNINPLQIIYTSSMKDISEEEAIDIYDNHKDLICASLKTYFEAGYSPNMDSLIDQSLNELYKTHGIKRDDPSTWKDKTSFPVMDDLINKWTADLKILKGNRKRTCEALIDKTYKFAKGGSYDFINKPTDADFSRRFSVIDIVSVPKGLKEFMNVFITGILASQVSATGSAGLTIVIDEGGAFLRDPDLADIILTGLTQWRSQNTQLIFATQQFEDLKHAHMSEVFMANTFFKLVFGANMDESVIPFVQNFLHLKDQQKEDLMKLKQGECLVKKRNQYITCHVTPSEDEDAIIKGRVSTDKVAGQNNINDLFKDPYTIKDQYKSLSEEHNTIIESWISGPISVKGLKNAGFKRYNLPRALDSGSVNVWIHESRMKGKLVETQTPDHWATNIQEGAYLEEIGFGEVKINHYETVDVEGWYNGESYAFEFERDGSHSIEDIRNKFLKAKMTYDHVYIVSMASNAKKCIEAVEAPNTVPRGTQLKDFIDMLVKTAKKPVTEADFKPVFSEPETIAEGTPEELKTNAEKPAQCLESEPVLGGLEGIEAL